MFTHPENNLRAFGIHENMIVADLGAGTGFYSIIAGRMAQRGKVYAIEVQKDFLDTIKSKIREAHLSNIEVIWGDIEKIGGTKLGENVVDRVIVSNVFFQVEDKVGLIKEVKRILKPGGKILLIDHCPSRSQLSIGNFISEEKVIEFFELGGFSLERKIDAGEHHYGIIFINKSEKF
ncbi:MAG: class I SAM-dependent methyltransferase [Candidatus Paceibacterota bacterium]|jgi:ubiquinone/menaquinone biosynthesis C-methylase UbiE